KRFIMEAATKAEELLKANIEVMHRMAEALLEFEVLDDPQLDKLMAGEELTPPPLEENDEESESAEPRTDDSDTPGEAPETSGETDT
ncbi:MAG: ATP-dependent metalloprotease, partial [Candidatus Latescibacterota bacterium]|nr:ATP-dependent metalloprotease [Candidatus Latescibacterota bacterium]